MPKNVTCAALFQKKTADLSDGWYTRGAQLDPVNRSRYNQFAGTEPATLSMSILQAILAVLSQHVGNFRTAQNGGIGTAWLWSTSVVGAGTDFSWDLRDPEYAYLGGFANGLTYQMVVLHLLWCVLTERTNSQPQSSEVVARWQDLLTCMDTCRFARGVAGGWSKAQIARASCCRRDRGGTAEYAEPGVPNSDPGPARPVSSLSEPLRRTEWSFRPSALALLCCSDDLGTRRETFL